MKLPHWARPAAVGAAFVGAGTLGYVYLYATPRAALDKQLSAQRATNAQYESAVKERRRVSEAIKAVASTTLGAKSST